MTSLNTDTSTDNGTDLTPDIDVVVDAPEAAPKTTPSAERGVREEIVRALAEGGIEHTFAIQELTLPLALAGDDLIGQARTGMGKTLAFGAPLLHTITTDTERPLTGIPRALIVVPTRELCLQVHGDLAAARSHRSRPCAPAPTSSSAPRGACSTWPSRATCSSAGSRCWCWTRPTKCSTSASCPTSSASCARSPMTGSRCCSRRRCPTPSSRWPAPS